MSAPDPHDTFADADEPCAAPRETIERLDAAELCDCGACGDLDLYHDQRCPLRAAWEAKRATEAHTRKTVRP